MSLCNKNMTPLQRRATQRMGAALLLTVVTNFSGSRAVNPLFDVFPALSQLNVHQEHPSLCVVGVLAAISVIPVLFAVWAAGSYLKDEPDEFIRALVVRALLWGIAVTMAGDAIAGVYMRFYGGPFPMGVFNADLLFISTGIAFRLFQRSYR
jgi:hypothetical protein